MFDQLSTNPFLYSLSLTLLHFLWQGLLVAAVLKSVLSSVDKSKSKLRYSASCIAMLTNLAAALITFFYIYPNQTDRISNNLTTIPLTSLANEFTQQNSFFTYQELLPSLLMHSLPYISMLWLISISALACKLLIEIYNVNQLPKQDYLSPSSELLARFNMLAQKIHLKSSPKLLISLKIDVPMAIGWLKPVVLLPASMVTGLNTAQLEMLLLHELAHIRRYDYVINFIQTLIEILFFFHPSVAWVAKQIRNEREYCSDDIAVQYCGDPIAYAHTLTDTASLCAQGHKYTIPSMAMAASGGDLKERVLRLVDHHCAPSNNTSKWLAALSILLTIGLLLGNQLLNKPLIGNTFTKLKQSEWQYNPYLTSDNDNEKQLGNSSLDDLLLKTNLINNRHYVSTSIDTNENSNTFNKDHSSVDSIAQQLLNPNKNIQPLEISTLAQQKNIIPSNDMNNQASSENTESASVEKAPSTEVVIANSALKSKTTFISPLTLKADEANILNNTKTVSTDAQLSLIQNEQLVIATNIIQEETSNIPIIEPMSAQNTLVVNYNNDDELSFDSTLRQFKASTSIEDKVAQVTKTIKSINNHTFETNVPASLNSQRSDQSDKLTPSFSAIDTTPFPNSLTINNLYQQQFSNLNTPNIDTINMLKANERINSQAIWRSAKQLKSVDPVYPSLAKRKGIEIEIKVNFTIDEKGQVKDIKFAQQSRVNYFKSSIRAAIRKWRFLPAKKNEQAIESQMSKIFSFSLRA